MKSKKNIDRPGELRGSVELRHKDSLLEVFAEKIKADTGFFVEKRYEHH